MAKKGIAQITGSKVLKLGEVGHYHISKTYRPKDKANISHAKWKLYVKENNNWRELKPVAGTPPKIGSETTITITNQKLLGKELLLEAYLYEPEKSSPPGIVIKIEEGKKKIERVDLFRTDDSPISNGDVLKYGQSIIVKVITVNMPNEKVEITLYEDDENGEGHNANNEKNKVDSVEKRLDHDGFAIHTFKLPIDFQRIANAYMDGSQDKFHEYYINVKSATDSKASRNVNLPNPEYTFPEQEIEEVVISVKAKEVGIDPLPETGRTVSIVKEVKIEGLLDAYFAKKEYTKQTGEDAGTVEYTFGSNGNKTSTDAEKEKIAKIIVGKSQITSLKNKKEYTTVEAIKTALTATVYNKDQKITIKTFKLGEDFKRVNSAPLEEKLYLVATTSMLDGKEVTLSIKEKDGIIKGSAGAILPVLEITEEQMEQKNSSGAVQETEKTEFKGTVQDGMVKIPIHLRPKSDDELKQWKDKLAKGKQDGTYTYTFASQTALPNGSGDEKKRVAGAILTNAKEGKRGNPKIETGKTAFADDIEKALVKEVYLAGQTISFPLYKKETEFLYLQAKAQGEKQHDKEFLKQDGAYFQIRGGKCSCNRDLTESEFKEILKYLRQSEKLEINDIWKPRNAGGMNPIDLSLSSTLEKLNEVMNKYEINTCIRKVYFIAECYHETDRFYSTREYNSSHTAGYDPHRGRGIIQLTHKEAYERYAFYRGDNKILSNLDSIATNLELAFDSAGWYFRQGKGLTEGSSWSPNSTDQKKYNLNTRSYPKTNYDTKFTNSNGSIIKRYGSINLNLVADNDDINVISYLINGGDNGLTERKKYLNELKKISFFICEKSKTDSKSGDWHDPVDNPISTNFYQNGNFDNTSKIWGLFGDEIRREVDRKHTGLDLFAERGKPVYACVDGTIYNRRWHTGYGNTITIKIKDPKTFLERKRSDYAHKTNREMTSGTSWSESGDIYLFYAHLHSVNEFTFGQEVTSGQQIGTTGRSGVSGGTCAPHLHFEIFCSYRFAVGTNYRFNPAYFVSYKFFDEQSEDEKNAQIKEKNRGQIREFNGESKLSEQDLS